MTELHSTIDTYLEAYGEPDDDRRAALIGEVWAEDGRLVDPPLDAQGHVSISEMAAVVQSHYPGHTFRRTSGVDEHHGFARYAWDLVAADGTSALVGVDVAAIGADGRIKQVIGFLGPLPEST